jgi:hypothetical protein
MLNSKTHHSAFIIRRSRRALVPKIFIPHQRECLQEFRKERPQSPQGPQGPQGPQKISK